MTNRPWQLEWKQPQWQTTTTETTTTTTGSLIDHAAARVHATEVAAYDDKKNDTTTSNNSATFVMTVSLLQQQPTALVLCVNLTKHNNDSTTTTTTRLTSRVLTWPSSLQEDVVSWPWQSWFRHKSTTTASRKNTIMAVCLCRWAPPKTHEEALDLLHGLALVPFQDHSTTTQDDDEEDTTPKELMLVCLTNTGTVYMYNPWQLLSTTTPAKDDDDSTILQDSMVSFLLGDALFQTLQSSMVPWSRPLRTWSIHTTSRSMMDEKTTRFLPQILQKAVVAFDLLCVLGVYDDDQNDDTPTTPQSGFLVFASLRTCTELRTVRLSFVPLAVTPILWKRNEWVLVMGATQAVLIRTDASSSIIKETDHDLVVNRFQVLPIDLAGVPMASNTSIVAWGMRRPMEDPVLAICQVVDGSTVRIWTRTLVAIRRRRAESGSYGVTTKEMRASCTEFPWPAVVTTASDMPRFHMGPGWILVVGSVGAYLVCLEGATSNEGAHVQRLSTEALHANQVVDIAGLDQEDEEESEAFDFELPLSQHDFSMFRWQEGKDGSSWNDTILNALENISNDASASSDPSSSVPSSKDKIQRLLRHCSSWKQLDESNTARKRYFEQQLPCVSVGSQFMVTFRKSSMIPKTRVPFQSVLSWLSSKEDYFTAASLALSLLQDVRTLRHLWQRFDKTENDDDVSTLEGLLDGILPLSNDKDSGGSTLSQLADMAIGCLIKGGVEMSATLTLFLATNQNYDPSRICLMLAAATSTSCSAWNNRTNDVLQHSDMEQVLWPARALLEVGNARDCLWTAMLLLNAIIPDELRCRKSTDVNASAVASMELCQALVRLVVTLSDAATQMLFNLVDEQSQKYFWESLDESTRQELALIEVGGKFPMLRQMQVRSWAASHLLSMVEQVTSMTDLPLEWLKRLAMSCLFNAECPLALQHLVVLSLQDIEDDPLKRYRKQVSRFRTALVAAPGSGGLDFDLLIPCLLLLRTKNEPLFDSTPYPIQSILNAACYWAGRRNAEVPLFPMNAVVLMRECFITDNVLAGAHLIGGKDGLVLQCCHVLMDCLDDISMTEAEQFLLAPATTFPVSVEKNSSKWSSSTMELNESQCLLLFLLEEHVLSIRKYGDFDSAHSRERVDPAFAARTILRTWWRCTSSSTEWIMEWLDGALQLGMKNRTSTSPYRLACAAVIRVLMWSEDDTPSLATRLRFSNDFLVQLSLSCCGLVEALPSSVMEQSWKQQQPYASPNSKTKRSDSPPCSPITTPSRMHSDGMDDSFQSAVSSLDMIRQALELGDLFVSHVETLCTILKEHKSITSLKLKVHDAAFGPNFSHLRDLLSHNRRITVSDKDGKIYSDGSSIDELYSLNRFYRGSAGLVVVPVSERALLVATALEEKALHDFQRSALLLSNHADALCELVQFAQLDEPDGEDAAPSRSVDNNSLKRRRQRIQPSRAAKRTSGSAL